MFVYLFVHPLEKGVLFELQVVGGRDLLVTTESFLGTVGLWVEMRSLQRRETGVRLGLQLHLHIE